MRVRMEHSSLLHRPQSEYAYLYDGKLHLRLRTKGRDVKKVTVWYGDPYALSLSIKEREMKQSFHTGSHDYWTIALLPPPSKRMAYGFQVTGLDGTVLFYGDQGFSSLSDASLQDADLFFRMPYQHVSQEIKTHPWVQETVWYQIFIDRFHNGDKSNDPPHAREWDPSVIPRRDDFFGGDLKGILNKLNYLEELGINGIYLTPVFEAYSNHKYDTVDYEKVDAHFGDKETLKKLVEEAHNRGIRVMLDAVFNHIGYWSKEWQDVLLHQEDSYYKNWFYIEEFPVPSLAQMTAEEWEDAAPSQYETFAKTGHMPKLNFENLAVREYFLEIAKKWTEELGIDAWRLDVSNEVDPEFWRLFKKEVQMINPDLYILGEIWHSARFWLEGDQFDGVMNYSYVKPIEEFFLKKTILPSQFQEKIGEQLALYPHPVQSMNFNLLDSHDTSRILTKASGNKKRVQQALTFMFMQPGAPCLYYGTEVGMEGGPDPDNRRCMVWDETEQDHEMFTFSQKIIALRRRYASLLSKGVLEWFNLYDKDNTVGIRRILDGEVLSALFNLGEYHQRIELNEGEKMELSSNESASVEPGGFIVIKGRYLKDNANRSTVRLEK